MSGGGMARVIPTSSTPAEEAVSRSAGWSTVASGAPRSFAVSAGDVDAGVPTWETSSAGAGSSGLTGPGSVSAGVARARSRS